MSSHEQFGFFDDNEREEHFSRDENIGDATRASDFTPKTHMVEGPDNVLRAITVFKKKAKQVSQQQKPPSHEVIEANHSNELSKPFNEAAWLAEQGIESL